MENVLLMLLIYKVFTSLPIVSYTYPELLILLIYKVFTGKFVNITSLSELLMQLIYKVLQDPKSCC